MKKNLMKVISILISAVIMTTSISTISAESDNEYSDWAGSYINEAATYGILTKNMQNGYKTNITREHFCDIAYNMIKRWGIDTSHKYENSFVDTKSERVAVLYGLGIVNGKDSTHFEPNSNITREEAAVILSRMAMIMGLTGKNDKFVFDDDASVSEWAKDAVYKVYSLGIMTGISERLFSPKGQYTKEQAIVTIMRLYDMIKE